MSNRVTELERQVSELQAAVNGLTEELVETKERVRQLEAGDASGSTGATADETSEPAANRSGSDQPGAGPTPEAPEPTERTTKSDDHVNVVEQTESDGDADATAAAAEAAEAAADAAADDVDADTDEDTTGGLEESDIIVA
ncbi:hypothetical protein SAMN05192561_101561 [Halopenitus malekzadehii]|uniref:BZIP transcription factor n=1 Tax=Halopenitus malekzadehii TaxID=1267564 RepID=A0A1H6HW41_9EURY|nr:hypothetical protein [Halopenitus malekzadehii]SEH39877.1 hypothetical protein SAMN05192561_101561 [Halopenitus malekzadehii]